MRLRPAVASDLDDARNLLARANLPIEGVEDQFDAGYAVALQETGLVGLAGIEVWGRYGLLRSVVVAAEARGRGIGEALVRDRLAWARRQHLEAVYLLTTTASGYFPRLGFAPVRRDDVPSEVRASKEFAGICPGSALVMRLPLTTAPPP